VNNKTKFKLTIPKPCSQNWSEMPLAGDGRFCDSCQKCVTDFTKLSNKQLCDYFDKATGNICGQFNQDQLNHYFSIQSGNKSRQLAPQIFLSAALTVGLANKTSAKEICIQNNQIQVETTSENDQMSFQNPSGDSSHFISGIIFEFDRKEPIPYVNISIKDSEYGTMSDIDGNFKLPVPDSLLEMQITIVFSCVGYDKKEMQISSHGLPIKTEVILNPGKNILKGELIIIRKQTLWNKIFHKKELHDCK
jgi:hypothetical protein